MMQPVNDAKLIATMTIIINRFTDLLQSCGTRILDRQPMGQKWGGLVTKRIRPLIARGCLART
jgi:hypothetical protein